MDGPKKLQNLVSLGDKTSLSYKYLQSMEHYVIILFLNLRRAAPVIGKPDRF